MQNEKEKHLTGINTRYSWLQPCSLEKWPRKSRKLFPLKRRGKKELRYMKNMTEKPKFILLVIIQESSTNIEEAYSYERDQFLYGLIVIGQGDTALN